jgi:hypothetical protein
VHVSVARLNVDSGKRSPQLKTEILGEISRTGTDPSSGSIMTTTDSSPKGAARPVGVSPGGLIVLAIAPAAAEIETGVSGPVPAVTVRTPSTKLMV